MVLNNIMLMNLQLLGGENPPDDPPKEEDLNEDVKEEYNIQDILNSFREELSIEFDKKLELLKGENETLKQEKIKFQVIEEMRTQGVDLRLYDFIISDNLENSRNKISLIKEVLKDVELSIRHEIMKECSYVPRSNENITTSENKPPYMV